MSDRSGDDAHTAAGAYPTSTSKLCDLLAPPRRRYAIKIIAEGGGKITVRELARRITAIEQDIPLEHARGDPYRNVYTSLTQTHLDHMAKADVVQYDSDRKVITAGESLEDARLLLQAIQKAQTESQ